MKHVIAFDVSMGKSYMVVCLSTKGATSFSLWTSCFHYAKAIRLEYKQRKPSFI